MLELPAEQLLIKLARSRDIGRGNLNVDNISFGHCNLLSEAKMGIQ
jgi:hypothetical protein